MTIQFDSLPPEKPQQEKKPGCLFRTITGIIILALLASSIFSLAWFVRRQTDTQSPTAEKSAPLLPTEKKEKPAVSSSTPSQSVAAPAPAVAAQPRINRIVIVNKEGQLETVAPDGSEQRILTGDEYAFQYPAWSPDGSQIAALGSSDEGSGIFLLEDKEEPSAIHEVFFGGGRNPFYLYWSPDSSKISFLAARFGRQMSLNIVDALEDTESRLIATGSPFFWNWTADSEQLLIHSSALSDDARLALIDKEGSSDQVTEIAAPGYFQAPGISPSGDYWAYSQLQDGGNSWLTIDDRQSGDKQTERHAGSLALSWSPIEDKLAFISGEDNGQVGFWGPLRLVDAASGEMRVLSSNLVLAFFWSPNGRQIATISVPFDYGLDGGVEVRGPKLRQLAKTQIRSLPPAQRTPHKFNISVIDVDSGSGLELGEVSFPTSFLTQFLVFFDQYALSHSLWSPDSDALILPILKDNESQLTVISTKSGRMNPIGQGQIAFWSPQ